MPRRPAPGRDPIEVHPVMLALSKARAMASVLEHLGETTVPISNDLVNALRDGNYPAETLEWLHGTVAEALAASLDEAEAALRKSLTPEQVHEQVFGGPTAVA